jgi:hypothetical protein
LATESSRHNAGMLENLPICRSAGTRNLFLASSAITIGVVLLANNLPTGASQGLTSIFKMLFSIGDSQAADCALLILLVCACAPIRLPVRSFLRWVGLHPISIALAITAFLGIGSWLVYQNSRLSMDEYAQFFQSQIFAAGHLSGRFPVPLLDWLIPTGFQNYFLAVSKATGAVASAYWPSFALLLTPFTWLGIPWACNPVLSGLTVWLMHRLAMRIFDNLESAGLAVLFTVASPVFFADGVSYYSMAAHLLANIIFALLLIEPNPRRAFAAGLVGSFALTLHNPVPHMLFAVPWIISLLRQPGKLPIALWLFAGYLPLCLLFGFGWFFHVSQIAHDGVKIASGATAFDDSLSQVYAVISFPTITVLLARVIGVAKIWTWSTPGLMLLACYGGWKWRRNRYCLLLCTSSLLTLVMYALIPVDQGHGWGYRYFHSAWMALPILGAAVFTPTVAKSENSQFASDADAIGFVVACALLSLVLGTGLRAQQMQSFISEHERQVPQYQGTERRVVILNPNSAYYGFDLVQNDPWLHSDVIRMITHGGAQDAQMMHDHFQDMRVVYQDKFGSVWSAK